MSDASRRMGALFRKETIQIVRDPSTLLIAIVLPMILLFFFGYALSLDANVLKVGLAVEGQSGEAQSLAAAFRGSSFFDVSLSQDRRDFEDDVVAGRLRGLIVIPADFDGSASAAIQVIADGSEPNTAAFVQSYARGVWQNWQAQQAGEAGLETAGVAVEPRFWFNPELHSRYFLVPGAIAIVMTLIGTLLTALVVAREWERGTMEAMMATPIGVAELLICKLSPYFLLGLGSMGVCATMAVTIFDVPFRGSVGALVLISTVFLFPALGQGLLISAATKNQFVASQLALLSAFLPAFLLSGFIFEIDSMPVVLQVVTHLVAARYLIPCLQTVFLSGDIWSLFIPEMGAMLAIGAVLLLLAARTTRKRLD